MATVEKRRADDGELSYRVKVRLKGHPGESATFERLSDAKKWAQQTEAAIREGRHFRTSEAKRHTLADLIDRYVRDVLPTKPKSEKKQSAQLEFWKRRLGDYSLADVTPALIAEVRDELMRQGQGAKGGKKQRTFGPATTVRYMASISHALSTAVKEWGWLDDSPMRKVKRPKEPRGRVRFLSDDERARLLEACRASPHPALYPVVVLALSTGMRKGEIMGLTWDDVDLSRGRAVLHETKNGERRAVHITGHALDVMKEHAKVRRIDGKLIFPEPPKAAPAKVAAASNEAAAASPRQQPERPALWRPHWEDAVKRAKLDDFRFHDLRHSAASYLAMGGASLAEIAEVLGHKTLQMVKRYSHLSDTHVSRVVANMNERIFGAR